MIEVILMERIERLGQFGQVVKVRPGYARNYLLPQRKALRATKSNMEVFEKQREQLEARNAHLRSDAEAGAQELEGVTVMIIRQAGESGQLYGSVTARDVAESATSAGHKIERRAVEIAVPIKTTGLFPVKVKLHPEISVTITVNVARTEEEGRMKQQKEAALAAKAAEAAAVSTEAVFAAPPPADDAQPDGASAETADKPAKKRTSRKKTSANEEEA